MEEQELFIIQSQSDLNRWHHHQTWDSAKAEAQRLARKNPGTKFTVLRPVYACTKKDYEEEFFTDFEIPF